MCHLFITNIYIRPVNGPYSVGTSQDLQRFIVVILMHFTNKDKAIVIVYINEM
jgi:hypothetical protein